MHIKHMHEMIEKLAECTKKALEENKTYIGDYPIGDVVEMLKELNEAEYYARIAKAMEKEEEDEKEEEKYMLRMLKEEHGDEYKRMREEYGEDEGERRFYDNYRYKKTGEFAPKGRGSYMPRSSSRRGRRGYVEPPYLHMPYDYRYAMDDYDYADAERMRDMDRTSHNKMYFAEPMRNRDMDGGYPGRRDGETIPESRYDKARRGYEEVKSAHKGNTPEDKQLTMREMEKVLGVVFDEIDEMLEDASPEMKNMVKTRGLSRFQKIQ